MDELQKYQFLISNISDLVYICDATGNITYVNPVFEKLTGHKPEAFFGKTFAPLFNESDLKRAMDVYARTLAGESPEYVLAFRDTGVVCEYKNFPLRDAEGKIVGVMGIARDITERKRAEEELRVSSGRYRAMFDGNPHPMWVYDLDTLAFLAVNDAAIAHYGYSREEFLSMSIKDIRPPEDIPRLLDNVSRVTEGLDRAGSWRHVKRDGTIIHVEIVSHTLDFGGRRTEVVLATDITARLQAEQALRQSRRHLRAIIDTEPECVKVLDAEGTIVDINPAGAAMVEADTPAALCGVSIYSFIAPKDKEPVERLVRNIFSGASGSLEFEITGLKGTRKCLKTHAVPLRDDQGMVTSLLGITRDITEEKKTIEALQQEKQRLEDVTSYANCGLLLHDADMKVVYANKVAQEWFGPLEAMQGMHCWEFFGLGDPERQCAGIQACKTGEVVRSEIFTKVIGGAERSFYAIASPVKDGRGNVVQVTEVLVDVTERKHLEEQVLHMQKMESLGQLASGIAHDFNNVLAGIIGYADLGLMKLDERHPLYENFRHIADLAQKGGGITRQLLAFARKQVMEPVHIDLNAVVANLLKLLGKALGEQIEIRFTPGRGLAGVLADPARIEQVLMNLCVNARDAMPEGGTITIATQSVVMDEAACRQHAPAVPGNYILLSVTDTGIGMDETVRDRIFEPFFTTKETGRGTGLGLSIVYGVVGQHKGFIEVESEAGKGTVFKVYLPAEEGAVAASGAQAFPSVRGGSETILVVEDEYDVRAMMRAVLKEYGYTVISVAGGEEGLREFERNADSVSLVVTDMVMPKMSGMELYRRVREISPQTRFLMVSGYVPDEERERMMEAAEMDFLHKPFGTAEFASLVRQILDRPAA